MSGAGDLDRRVRFEQFSETDDTFGAPAQTWTPITIVWARREDLLDRERFAAGETEAPGRTRWIVRSSGKTREITPKDRMIDADGAVYQIDGIRETSEGRKRFLEFSTIRRID